MLEEALLRAAHFHAVASAAADCNDGEREVQARDARARVFRLGERTGPRYGNSAFRSKKIVDQLFVVVFFDQEGRLANHSNSALVFCNE